MPWMLIAIGVVAFVLVSCTTSRRRTCPKGCHGCGRCMKTMHRTPPGDRYNPAEREAEEKKKKL